MSTEQTTLHDPHDWQLLPTLDLAELEKLAIVGALEKHAGNRTHAARALGMSVRTLQRKIGRYELPSLPSDGNKQS